MLSVMNPAGEKKLIVNADDFGLSKAVTDAIIDCHSNGIVTSTTLLANMSFAEYAASRAKAFSRLSVGLHLNLTQGKPISDASKINNLVDSEGNFLNSTQQSKNLKSNKTAQEQVFMELEAQLQRALDLGLKITHFDSHNRIQKMPVVISAIIKLHKLYGILAARTQNGLFWTSSDAKFYTKLKKNVQNLRHFKKIHIRWHNHLLFRKNGLLTPDRMVSPKHLIPSSSDPKEQFIQCIKSLNSGISELYLHPGYDDKQSEDSEAYKKVRAFDVQIVCDEDVKACIKESNIKLISYNEL